MEISRLESTPQKLPSRNDEVRHGTGTQSPSILLNLLKYQEPAVAWLRFCCQGQSLSKEAGTVVVVVVVVVHFTYDRVTLYCKVLLHLKVRSSIIGSFFLRGIFLVHYTKV
jgi:hypothetical protein